MRNAVYIVVLFLLTCCASKQGGTELSKIGTTDTVKFAKGFTISRVGKLKIVRVFNPWEGAKGIEYKYVLCPRGVQVPDSLKKNEIIEVPVKRIVCLSTTHIALLSFLDKRNTLVGAASPGYISDTVVRRMVKQKKVLDVGFDQALNYEILISLKPDMVLAYGIQGETATQFKRLEDLGVKVVMDGEYLESSPLGKLEWVKFLAAFYNVSDEATSKFNKIEQEYCQLAKMCDGIKYKPKVMSGLPWKGAWYVPGGESYIAQMIKDAGGDYIWNDIPQRESIPLNFEKVIERASNADIWIDTGASNSLKDILNEDVRLQNIKPFMENQVYNNNALTSPMGGNDFWESGIVRPQVILKDLIKIFHPELLPHYSLVYYQKLR
jgi:iron complex transport system substrate-binding protein